MKKILITALSSALSLFTLSSTAAEQDKNDLPINNLFPQAADRSSDAASISRREASDLAREKFEGRVLSIRMDENNWRVRMDSDGTVFNVFVNADSGNVSSSPNE